MKVADYITEYLAKTGTERAFVFTGGAIAHVIDSLRHHRGKLDYIVVQNEQVGAMAAEAYSRTTGKLGVAAATSGPGATNLITGIAGAWYDCIPALFLTGQVRTWELTREDDRLLQRGFQEVDIVDSVKKITKYATIVKRPEDIRYEMEKAIYMAYEGRPGPVLLDLPMDVQWADIEPQKLMPFCPPKTETKSNASYVALSQAAELLKNSKTPLFVCGGGVRHGDAGRKLLDFCAKHPIPVISSYAGYDVMPYDHPCNAGVMGQFAHPTANFLTSQADVIVCLGARNSIKQVGNNADGFAPQAKIVSVNVDEGELLDGRVRIDAAVKMDAGDFLAAISDQMPKLTPQWRDYARGLLVAAHTERTYKDEANYPDPHFIVSQLSEKMSEEAIIIPDVGQNVMYTCQHIRLSGKQRLFSSWGNSPMGYSLPAAIGAASGNPDKQIVCVIGDGGLQVNIQDLQTVKQYRLPIKIFLFNNSCYATIHEFQDGNLGRRYEATDLEHGYSHPNFQKIADAYDLTYFSISNNGEANRIDQALSHDGPVLCEIKVDPLYRASDVCGGNAPLHTIPAEQGLVPFASNE